MSMESLISEDQFLSLCEVEDTLAQPRYNENLKVLHRLATTTHDDFEALIRSYLQAGCQMFGLSTGILSHIEGDDYQVEFLYSTEGGFSEGDSFPLNMTYCREVWRSGESVLNHNIGGTERGQSHPCYQETHIEAYIAAPVYVFGKIYGTINYTRKDGRERPFSCHEVELLEVMAVSVGGFLEARKMQKALLDQAQQLTASVESMSKFLSRVSHDLRGPVGTSMGLANIIASKTDDPKILKCAEGIVSLSERALSMMEDLLTLAHLSDGDLKINVTSWCWADLVGQLQKSFSSKMLQKSINFVDRSFPDLMVTADQNKVYQILSNLLSNAVKFTREEGKIEILAEEVSGGFRFLVKDNGVGLDEKSVEMLLGNEKLSSSQGTKGETGTALGLQLCVELLKAMGSKLELQSALGEGTQVSFVLQY